jgi:hypothetical protein
MKSLREKYELVELLAYLFIAFLLVYYVPVFFGRILFLFFIPIMWRTKRDYIWLAFFIILSDTPGGFFSGGARDDLVRLPIYTFVPGISVTITQIYLILILFKAINNKHRKNRPKIFFQKNLAVMAYYFIMLLVVSFILGMSFQSMQKVFKVSVNLTIFYSIFYILSNKEELTSFLKLLFPFAFAALIFQLYGLVFGFQPVELFKPGASSKLFAVNKTNFLISAWNRPLEMVFSLFINFSGSIYLWGNRDTHINKLYLIVVNIACFISMFLSGTRSWTLAFAVSYIIFSVIVGGRISKSIPKVFVGVILIFILLKISPILNAQFYNAWDRLSTVEQLSVGDLTLGGTAGRYQNYAPRVWEGFKQSTIFMGAGFSDLYFKYTNIHVGYHNLLLNVGMFGIMLHLALLVKILKVVFLSKLSDNSQNMKLGVIPIIMLLIINTAVQSISYAVIHTPFFIIQAFSLALMVIADNSGKKLVQQK